MSPERPRWSFGETLVFWWVLLLLVQQAQRLVLEYVGDVLEELTTRPAVDTQVGRQTVAEVQDLRRWIVLVGGYLALEIGALATWWLAFRRWIAPPLAAWQASTPRLAAAALPLVVGAGAWGLHPDGPDSVQAAGVGSSTYYALAQNPIW